MTSGTAERPSRLQARHALPVLALLAMTLAFYWNITLHFTDRIASDGADGAMFAWDLWYFPHALLHGHNPFATNALFFPTGVRLGFHTYAPLLGLVSAPIAALFGLPVAINTVALLGPFLSGLGAYFLAHYLTKDRWASLFAGAAFIMWADRAFRISAHMNLNHVEFLPFALLALIALYDKRTFKSALVFGVVAGLSAWVDFTLLVFIALFAIVFAACKWRATFSRLMLVRLLIGATAAVVVALPVLVPAIADLRANELDPIAAWGGADSTSADVLSYVTPSKYQPLWGSSFARYYDHATGGERFAFTTFTLLILGLAGAVVARKQFANKRIVTTIGAVFLVLSFGPFLHVNGHTGSAFSYLGSHFSLPMPYLALHFVPVLNGVRIPARFSVMVILVLAVLAAGAFARLRSQRGPTIAAVAVVVCIGLMGLEAAPSSAFPAMTAAHIPSPYQRIAEDPGVGAVLEIPMQWRDGFGQFGDNATGRDDTQFLYYATEHGKPLVSGMVARLPKKRLYAQTDQPVLAQILTLQGDRTKPAPSFTALDLRAAGIGYVVVHADRPMPDARAYLESLGLPVLADAEGVKVWKVPNSTSPNS